MTELSDLESEVERCGFTVELEEDIQALSGAKSQLWRIRDYRGRLFPYGYGKNSYPAAVRRAVKLCETGALGGIVETKEQLLELINTTDIPSPKLIDAFSWPEKKKKRRDLSLEEAEAAIDILEEEGLLEDL